MVHADRCWRGRHGEKFQVWVSTEIPIDENEYSFSGSDHDYSLVTGGESGGRRVRENGHKLKTPSVHYDFGL